ncbi:hypothetical protein ACFOW1_07880 [Parasediminibacterium paludis]|uniref:Uncharacterized protein n=1 Tax=Parasediminibacterium paludis TaxID=908966 RepID=A0ABV8PYD3_9BACT
MIYYGKIANEILNENLGNRKFNTCKGYFLDKKVWIAFDNTTGNCWVEEFKTEELAICWLENFYEMSEIEDFIILKIQKDLFFLPDNGFLKIQFLSNKITSKLYQVSTFGIEAKSTSI